MTVPHWTIGIDVVDDLALSSALVGCGTGGTWRFAATLLRQTPTAPPLWSSGSRRTAMTRGDVYRTG
ncbi:hypothetical protein ACFYXS_06820 [Streptomyces sp. NPDC002574]|uniref:hypothetical protein n=1 Tax=Streptomyces sp. NPDC002574 TaxID=3364652 RepID=UPI00367A71BB